MPCRRSPRDRLHSAASTSSASAARLCAPLRESIDRSPAKHGAMLRANGAARIHLPASCRLGQPGSRHQSFPDDPCLLLRRPASPNDRSGYYLNPPTNSPPFRLFFILSGATDTALASRVASHHAFAMFLVTEADAEAIRTIFNQEGELSAAIELRRRFPGITDNAKARPHVRTITGWKPPPSQPCTVTRLRPGVRGSEFHSPGVSHTPPSSAT
jgi:hypothetical protein